MTGTSVTRDPTTLPELSYIHKILVDNTKCVYQTLKLDVTIS